MDCVLVITKISIQVVARSHDNFNVLELRVILVAINFKVLRVVKTVHASLWIVPNLRQLVFHALCWLVEFRPVIFGAFVEWNYLLVLETSFFAVDAGYEFDVSGVIFHLLVEVTFNAESLFESDCV